MNTLGINLQFDRNCGISHFKKYHTFLTIDFPVSNIIFPLFVFLLSSRFLLLYVALIVQHIFPSPTATYFLTHVENIYGIALKQNWSYKNSPGYHVRGLSKKIR